MTLKSVCIIFVFMPGFLTSNLESLEVKLGILVDFNDSIVKGIQNNSLINWTERKSELFGNISAQVQLITDHSEFEILVEDNPFHCNKYISIISALSCSATKSLYSLVREYCPSTLLLSIHDRKCDRPSKDQGIGFPVLASIHDIVPMLVDMQYDILRNWRNINLIHDHSLNQETLHDLVQSLSTPKSSQNLKGASITTYFCDSSRFIQYEKSKKIQRNETEIVDPILQGRYKSSFFYSIADILKLIEKEENLKYFIIIAQSNMIQELIELASTMNLLRSSRYWLIVFSDVEKNPSYWRRLGPIFSTSNIAIVTREASSYRHCSDLEEGCQFRLAMETIQKALKKVGSSNDFNFNDSLRKGQLKNRLLAEMRLQLGNEEVTAQYCGNCNRFLVQNFELTNIKDNRRVVSNELHSTETWMESFDEKTEIQIKQAGEWTPFKGLLNEQSSVVAEKINLAGRKIRVGIFNQPPFINVQTIKKECILNGTTVELFKLLSSRMNFSIEWVCYSNISTIGSHYSNGSYDGLLEKIALGQVEIAANAVWKTPSRIKSGLFEFFFPYDIEMVGIMVQKVQEDNEYLFLTPFTMGTWVCIIACVVVIGYVVWVVHRSAKYYDYYNCRDKDGLSKLGNCIWYCYGAIVQQGGDLLPLAISGRLLIASWWIFVIVAVTTYSGNLVALLTFPKIIQPIENAQDLRDTWGMRWGVGAPSEISETVEVVQYGGLKTLRDGMQFYNFERDKYKIFDQIIDGKLGFLLKHQEAKLWISTEYIRTKFCGMHVAKESIYQTPIHIVARKNIFDPSTVSEFNKQIMQIAKAGIMVYWRLWYKVPGNDCLYPSLIHAGEVKKVDTIHMKGSYLLLGWGLILGLLALFGELLYFGYKSRDQTGGRINITNIIHGAIIRLTCNRKYDKWASNMHSFDPYEKASKLSFIHPQISSRVYTKDLFYKNTRVRAKANQSTNYSQIGSLQSNAIRSIYSDPANFQYFSFAPLRPSYKPKLK